MGNCDSAASAAPGQNPVLYYMPIAARGEVARLVAAVGGLTMPIVTECPDDIKKAAGSPSSLPILVHGDLKLSQSTAIVDYLLRIAPRYKNLTPTQHAKDVQFNCILDDVIVGLAKILFDPRMKEDPSFAPTEISKVAEKWFPVVEGILPSSGFVHGLPYPTGADFAVLIMIKGFTPCAACWGMAKVDPFSGAPKLKALTKLTGAFPEVKNHMDSSTTLNGNPFGLPQ